jgi:hypothetical protein
MAKRWSDEQEPQSRRQDWVRGPISLKPNTCTERLGVNAADISVKVGAHYPGRSDVLPLCYRWCEPTGRDIRSQQRA